MCTSKSILVEYRLRSFSPWLASFLPDVAMEGDVVQDPAQVIFIISKNPYSTKPMVILNFSTPSLFLLWPTVIGSLYVDPSIFLTYFLTV
jgi:hypothetical protein